MTAFATPVQWFLGTLLILSSLGIILTPKPIQSCLFFLLTLLALAALYLQLSAEFIAVMQVLVYAGAILVLFMFVIVLFQDAHAQLANFKPKSFSLLLLAAGSAFLVMLGLVGISLLNMSQALPEADESFGMVESLGIALYTDFFFPFEAVILLFLVAIIGSLYIGRKEI